MIVLCKKLGIEFEGKVVESCDEDFEVEGYTIFTCPALYHKVKDKVYDYRVLDLRVLKAFKNPSEVGKTILASESVYHSPEYDVVEVGKSVLYIGENLELVEELSLHCDLIVVTEKDEVVEKLYPYEVRVIKGKIKGIEGRIGRLKVHLDGVDVTNGREVESIEVGQVIYPGFEGDIEGVYKDEFLGAFKVLSNLGGFMKLVAVKINYDVCGAFKSGLIGCTYCLQCPNSAVNLVGDKVEVDLNACKACGFCSSICFTSAMQNGVVPSDKMIEKIDRVAEVAEMNVLAFVCEKALAELNRFKDLPDVAVITVPCLNHVNEVHYLYAVLKGFRVVAIPCKNGFKKDCFEIAKNTLKAFGFDCLRVGGWEDLKEIVNELKNKEVPRVEFRLEGRNKREMWLSLVESLMVYDLKEEKFETNYFGKVRINDNCTLCNACTNFCPMNAVRRDEDKIVFNHGLCIACGMCSKACPENALEVEKVLDFGDLCEKVVFEDEVLRCPRCGKPHISRRAYEKLKALTGMEKSLLFCKECRPKTILEGLYEEIVKEREELRKRKVGD